MEVSVHRLLSPLTSLGSCNYFVTFFKRNNGTLQSWTPRNSFSFSTLGTWKHLKATRLPPFTSFTSFTSVFCVLPPLASLCLPIAPQRVAWWFFLRIQMVQTQHAKHAKITPRTSVQWKQRMFMDTSQNIPCNLGWFVVQPTSSQQVTVAMGNLSWPWQSRKDQRLQTSISPLYICTMDLDTYMHNNIGSTNFFISTPCKGMTLLVQAKSVWDVTIMNMIYKFIH